MAQSLADFPRNMLTGRTPMIALATGKSLPRWYYGSDFWYFLNTDAHKDPANWREMIDNADSILWQKGLWDMMPPSVRAEIERDFKPVPGCQCLVFIKKTRHGEALRP
jgi:hypothetical protein